MPTCKKLLDPKTLEHILNTINQNVTQAELNKTFKIDETKRITGGRGGSMLFQIPYKGKTAVIKTYRIKKLPNVNNFDSFWKGNLEANGLIREIVIGCYFKNHKLFQTNIPTLYEWGIIKSKDNFLNIYYIQEYVNGLNLSNIIKNNNQHNGKQIFKDFDQYRRFHVRILKMLQKLYKEHKFIHHDIKMDNFMVKIDGDKRIPYMIDFGHASNNYMTVEKNIKFQMMNIKWNIYNSSKYRSNDDRSKYSIDMSKDKTHKLKYDLKFIIIGAVRQAKKLFNINVDDFTLTNADVKIINKLPYDKQIQYIMDNNNFYQSYKDIKSYATSITKTSNSSKTSKPKSSNSSRTSRTKSSRTSKTKSSNSSKTKSKKYKSRTNKSRTKSRRV